MRRRLLPLLAVLLFAVLPPVSAATPSPADPAGFVRTLLAAPDDADFGRAKLAVDAFVDPSIDGKAAAAKINAMVASIERMLSTLPPQAASTDLEKFRALRTFLYEPGWWNDGKPFRYNLNDPFGRTFATRLLPDYLASRQGNCISMPILFLVLGERLGLDVTLSTAPLHVFVKWTDPAAGQTWNLEATNGGFARDNHYREKLPMSDEAIANGVYLKTLTRREALSVISILVLEHLLEAKRYDEAIAVADVLLEAYPANAYVLAKKGTACGRLLEGLKAEFARTGKVPDEALARARHLHRANADTFAAAEALGWRMSDGNTE